MAEGKVREPLLKKKYYENCSGCKVDKLKETEQGSPIRKLLIIWIVVLATVLPVASLFPFLYFMIRDFHIAKKEEDIGFYAGYVGLLFYVFLSYLINDTQYGVRVWYECPHLIKCRLKLLQLYKDILPRLYNTVNALYKRFTTSLQL
ncbi:hypothetical protein AB3S75_012827 [Citrus x aurantiifolia]